MCVQFMKVRGHLQMYHAYIHESHPPSDSPPEEVVSLHLEHDSGKITMIFQPMVQESEPGWEMLDSGEGAVSGLNFAPASALYSNTLVFRWEGKRQEVQEEEQELLEGQLVEELGQRQRSRER